MVRYGHWGNLFSKFSHQYIMHTVKNIVFERAQLVNKGEISITSGVYENCTINDAIKQSITIVMVVSAFEGMNLGG